jgi:predicted nucleotidyltransferase
MIQSNWQPEFIDSINVFFASDPNILALAVFGSVRDEAAPLDQWSDVDMLVVAEPGTIELYASSTHWLHQLGEFFATESVTSPFNHVLRVCFTDFRRADFIFTTEAQLIQIHDWPFVAFWKGSRVLFSRSQQVDYILTQAFLPKPPRFTSTQFESMVNDFWFKAVIAVTKVVRGDLLIGLHLTLDLVRDCCVIGMILRDRAAQTTYHRSGDEYDAIVANLPNAKAYDTLGILNMIAASGQAFDSLAVLWDAHYQPRHTTFAPYLDSARKQIIHD